MQWIPFAMVRIAAIFICGTLASIYFPRIINGDGATVFLIIFILLYFLMCFLLDGSPAVRTASGLIGLGSVFLAGYLNVILQDESLRPDHLLSIHGKITAYTVKLITPAEEKEKSWKRTGRIQAIRTETGWRQVAGKVNLYWPKTEAIRALDFGDVLMVKGRPREIEGAFNPGEFDFKHFLRCKNTYHQHFIRTGEWRVSMKSKEMGFLFYAHRARNWSVAAIKQSVSSKREQAIVIALVLGVTDGLDNDLQSAYAASGAMHVLAVSGLHVSIIYGILMFFLRPLGNGRAGKWIIAVISLVLLWAYAFVTGLSPSVLRAVAMFTFVAIARPVGRNTNIYNTLAASAFCLLIYDPFLIMSVGFQLSYLAVLGIVCLQRPLYNLWVAKSALVNWAWQITCVSIAAQIATFALGLLYFHQFPIYFLLANLFVIPGSFVILVGGILLLIVSPFEVIAHWLGTCLEWFVMMVNEGIFLVERLPMSLINNLYISGPQCLLLLLLVIGVLLLIHFKRIQFAGLMLICSILFSLLSWHHARTAVINSRWTVYRIQGHSAMEWSENGHALFISDSVLFNDHSKIKFHIQPGRVIRQIRYIHSIVPSSQPINGCQFHKWRGKTFLFLRQKKWKLPLKLSVDYLVLANNSIRSLETLKAHVDFMHVILDSSNSYQYCDQLEKEARLMKKTCHSVLRNGAFVVDL